MIITDREIVNLTPHAVVVEAVRPRAYEDGSDGPCRVVIPPSGTVARVVERPVDGTTFRASLEVDGCWVQVLGPTVYGPVEGLPPETIGGPLYLVSALVAAAVRAHVPTHGEVGGAMSWGHLLHPRGDLLVPDTGPDSAIRSWDERGQIVAVRRLRLAS